MRCSTIALILTSATWVGCSSPQDVDPRSGGPTAFSYQVTFNPAEPVYGSAVAVTGYSAQVRTTHLQLYPGTDGVVRSFLMELSFDLDRQLPPGNHTLSASNTLFGENHARPTDDREWDLTQGS